MAATYDADSQLHTNTATANKISWTHTPVGTPTGVVVWAGVISTETVTGITYGGTSMTAVGSIAGSNGATLYAYKLSGPASGAQTVEITYSGGASSDYLGAAMTVTGGSTSDCVASYATLAAATIPANLSLSVASGDFAASAAYWWGDQGDTLSINDSATETFPTNATINAETGGSHRTGPYSSFSWTNGYSTLNDKLILGVVFANAGAGTTARTAWLKA